MNHNSNRAIKFQRLADAILFLRTVELRGDCKTPQPIVEAFALAFEVSWMQLRTSMRAAGLPTTVHLPGLFRQAKLHGFIDSADHWLEYPTLRDMVSMNGDAAHARAILAVLPMFLVDAEKLLIELRSRSKS